MAAVIYTYKGEKGKDKRYVYKLPELEEDIIVCNFRTVDVEKITLESIKDENPLKLVFKMDKKLLNTGVTNEEIYNTKIELSGELKDYG